MKYKVISVEHCTKDKAIEQLTEQVNELLEKGWRPQGGIAIAQIHAEWFLVAQAMLKKEWLINRDESYFLVFVFYFLLSI